MCSEIPQEIITTINYIKIKYIKGNNNYPLPFTGKYVKLLQVNT